ncbi:MAG TPA: dUTP diphosphatase, partial [Micrococcaceae bacterium]|nr:dUTP diphosphatase [Micrococcaceae bacterium]
MNEPTISVKIKMLDPDLPVPGYAHPSDAGADLHARESAVLQPGERALIR